MRHAILLAALAAATLASQAGAATSERYSWGKPGVSLDQYRRDAVKCGRAGYYADITKTDAVKVFRRATRELENNETDLGTPGNSLDHTMTIVTASAHIVDATRPEVRMQEVKTIQVDRMTRCLTGLGYIRFELTREQQAHLRRLHLGSPERHAYLYGLASDPAVLKAQAA
jgi:hypothetical protein